MNKMIERPSTDAVDTTEEKKKAKPIRSAAGRTAKRSAKGAAETGKAVGSAGRNAIPAIAHMIRSEQAMPVLRIIKSALIARVGTALIKRATRRPLVAALGLGFVAAAILAPEKRRKKEDKPG